MTAVSRRDSDSFSDLDQPDAPVFMIKNRAIERGDYASGLQFFVANCSAFSGTSKGFKVAKYFSVFGINLRLFPFFFFFRF